MSEVSIVCGLGNPEPHYRSNRHNLGFMALDTLSERHSLSWRRVAGPAEVALWRVAGRAVTLVKPLTWMNESGAALAKQGGAANDALLVVCDDLNLPLGALRLRPRGGSGGHKGLDSLIEHLGAADFPRLRLGIGSAPPGIDWVEFVLSDFLPEERDAVNDLVTRAADAIETAVRAGLDVAMRRFNAPGEAADGGAGSP
ncbi:MAG: aminoacyl-tRNA hydrolase [Candidatus Krumholzibacteria bacterium]|nr:aminoacyl-tRNA hydrolase [Candidatus Krumholzibacteria bacterium]